MGSLLYAGDATTGKWLEEQWIVARLRVRKTRGSVQLSYLHAVFAINGITATGGVCVLARIII